MSFWDVVMISASSERQAEIYRDEIQRRRLAGALPPQTQFLVVPDPGDRRVGSGGATINALGVLGRPRAWWDAHKVLLIHSGGDSRRLPQYSPGGKLFGVLPSRTRARATTTVFDETMQLSAHWAAAMVNGLLVASGDVVLRFNAAQVQWDRPGVTGVAMRLPMETGSHHGVYVVGSGGQVYTFLQKPSAAEVKAAGGMLADGRVAVDIGLLRFDPEMTVSLAGLAAVASLPAGNPPAIDLYDQITRGLTGQWNPPSDAPPPLLSLAAILRSPDRPSGFHCSVVDGEFIHAGTTRSFRALAAGVDGILDSVIAGECKLGHEAVVLECDLDGPVYASRGAILHGLTGIAGAVEVPEDTVVHQIPVDAAGHRAWVVRAYGVEDDPKHPLETATWFNRPILETLNRLGLGRQEVWPGNEPPTLWNAELFPVAAPDSAWACARWMMGYPGGYDAVQWRAAQRMSLAHSAHVASGEALAEARNHRLQGIWQGTALELAESGADLRPLLANLPGLAPAAAVGRSLSSRADALCLAGADNLTLAASHLLQASRLLERAGFEAESERAQDRAFLCIQDAVREGAAPVSRAELTPWRFDRVRVSAPPRIDLGGGWSDTPPFCFDWGGTVLNCAIEINGTYPIEAQIRRIEDPLIRCLADGVDEVAEYRTMDELLEPCGPGSVFSIPRAALQLHGLALPGRNLSELLRSLGGGLEIHCQVRLPIGSGLGTSSILGATVIRALAVIGGRDLDNHALSESVMQLEQRMTTGGGWQDQAGGIFPGIKLLLTGPGLRQRIRVQPLALSPERRDEFHDRMVLLNTGIQRMAKGLLRQIVSRYLARETATIQVLHSIKTLAVEMSYAISEGDWPHLGALLDRHWQLNKLLDPHTANAPINAILDQARPFIHGAKLAGAGGGGFLMMLARDREAADALRRLLSTEQAAENSSFVSYRIAHEGLRVVTGVPASEGYGLESVC